MEVLAGYLIWLATTWTIASFLGLMMSGQWFGGSGADTLSNVLNPSMSWDWFGSIGSMLTWDFDFFYGAWEIPRLLILMPVTFVIAVLAGYAVAKWIRGGG